MLEVVEHVFRVEDAFQGQRGVVGVLVGLRDLRAGGGFERPGGVSVAVVLDSGRFVRSWVCWKVAGEDQMSYTCDMLPVSVAAMS